MIKEIILNLFRKGIDFIFGKTVKIQHTFFGEMTDVGSYYECRRIFKGNKKIVEIGLAKKEEIIDNRQINFFKWIEENYEKIIVEISPAIEGEVSGFIPNYRIQNFKKEFNLEYLFIPKCDEDIFDWQISFYANNELQHTCSIDMRGTRVKQISIEG